MATRHDGRVTPATRATPMPRVAFQGELGAYGEEAIVQRWRGAATPVPSLAFDDVVDALGTARADYGIIPVWNTIVGDVEPGIAAVRAARALPDIPRSDGYIELRIRHLLLAPHGTRLSDVVGVASHPVALAQCNRLFERHPRLERRVAYDTAGAARELARTRAPHSAAIAGRLAAERYGLAVLASDVQDLTHNVTRFLVLRRAHAGALVEGALHV